MATGTLAQDIYAPGTSVSLKTVELLHQMQSETIHVLAVQEGRARMPRHVTHGPFECFISACNSKFFIILFSGLQDIGDQEILRVGFIGTPTSSLSVLTLPYMRSLAMPETWTIGSN